MGQELGATRIAFQTIAWGTQFRYKKELTDALDLIARSGYQGVEFSQRPDMDHLCVGSLRELKALANERKLEILGFAGGTLRDRMEFCGDDTSPYLLVYDWDVPFIEQAIQKFTVALHPRVFTPISRLTKAERLLNEHPRLNFIPDTAHLTIAGDARSVAVSPNGTPPRYLRQPNTRRSFFPTSGSPTPPAVDGRPALRSWS